MTVIIQEVATERGAGTEKHQCIYERAFTDLWILTFI